MDNSSLNKQETSPKPRLKEISSASGPWLHAWYDPMAHLKATSSRIATVDVTNDGNHALLVVDDSKRLKVFRGMNLISSHKLLDHASCLSIFYPSSMNNKTKISSSLPAVGVATGACIYIYRSMRPYFKFTLPCVEINGDEANIWNLSRAGDISVQETLSLLTKLKNDQKHIELTFRTMFILSITDQEEQLKYIEAYKSTELVANTCITCMASIKKEDVENHAVSSLIVATENNKIIFLDSSGCAIGKTITIPAIPFILSVIGLLTIDYRLIIATRSSTIYTIRNGKLLGNHIEMESAITAMAAFNKNIIVSCINGTLYAYHIKGNNVKLWSLYFKHNITCIEPMIGTKFGAQNLFLIGFENGHVGMYNNNVQMHLLRFDESPITALKFGKYGREDSALIILNQSGCLNVKIMSRRVDIKNMKNIDHKRSSELIQQEIPLDLPPITQLYLDQEIREKENAHTMHRIWQKEIVKFRLKTNNEYIKILQKGMNTTHNNNNILLNVNVIGLGPAFTLHIALKNIGKTLISFIAIVVVFNNKYYEINKPILKVPLLIPSSDYKYNIKMRCIHPNGNSDPVQLALIDDSNIDNNKHFPFMTAIVDLPLADMS